MFLNFFFELFFFSSSSLSVRQNFDVGSTVHISSQAFYAGADSFDDFE